MCGFYTPDDGHWLPPLIESMREHHAPFDFVQAEKLPGGREINAAGKIVQILAVMDRHPDKVIILLDVDCTVHGDLTPPADIRGDVAFRVRTGYRRRKGTNCAVQSGTVVVRGGAPYPGGSRFR